MRIHGFDGIRGISAVMVVVSHLGLYQLLQRHDLARLFPLFYGYAAVTFFFVLSGFLISSLLLVERDKTGSISLKHFLIRRSLRLYPLYYLVLGLIYASGKLGFRGTTRASLIYAGLYSYNFIPKKYYDTWIGAFHTLAVEEHFYLVFPLLMVLFRRRESWIIAGLATYALLAAAKAPAHLVTAIAPSLNATHFVGRWTFVAALPIALGCLGAFWWHRRKTLVLPFRWVVLVAGIVCYVTPAFYNDPRITVAGCTLLIFAVVLHQDAAWVRWLDIRPLRYLGKVSYGIYVWHCFYLTTGPAQIKNWPLPFPWNVILLCITVPISWHFLEQPFLRLKDRIGYRNREKPELQR